MINPSLLLACGLVVTLPWAGGAMVEPGSYATNGCHAVWSEKELTVGNSLFSRTFALEGHGLKTVVFERLGGVSWHRCPTNEFSRPFHGGQVEANISASAAKWSPAGVEGLQVIVSCGGERTQLNLFPGVPGVVVNRPKRALPSPVRDETRNIKAMRENVQSLRRVMAENDTISFAGRHVRSTEVVCRDQTDIRDQVVTKNERLLMNNDRPFTLSLSVLDLYDILRREGLVFARLAPMPTSRPEPVEDFVLTGERGGAVSLLGNGYPLVELAYAGGEAGMRRALVAFQRALRPYRPGRDGLFLSNTWGGGNRDSRICEEFLLKEIDAGAKMGVDVIQIDDGWQSGRTQNSDKQVKGGRVKKWNGYWDDPDFWKEDRERFPQGLKFLIDRAAEKGLRFGLWFGPDSSNDAMNWEKDANLLLGYHHRLGIDFFKLDSLKLNSQLALERNRRMFDKMLAESDGAMVFDQDCTAEIRPGFFGLVDIGASFVENRYISRSSYWPHHTLKNLWDLSHVIDPVRLRFEFNNPDRHHDNFKASPLGHGSYSPDTLFATVMASSPLAWMELSDVTDASLTNIAALVKVWKGEREKWHGGVIHPVGGRPDGVSWTGFVSECTDGTGYALIFREYNAKSDFTFDLESIFGTVGIEVVRVLAGRGTAADSNGTSLKVSIPRRLDYLWVKFKIGNEASGYNVRRFGAKGDGVTDDTMAIRRAVSALEEGRPDSRLCVRRYKVCHREAPCAAIVFPKGTYRITSPIVVNGDAMLVGENGATIVNESSDKETFYVREAHNLIVKGLTFLGGLCQIRLWTRNRDNSYLHVADCNFKACAGTSVYSVSFKKSEKKPSEPIETAYEEVRGIPYNNSTLMIVERCRFENNSTALRLYSDGLTVRNCTFVAPPSASTPQLNVGSGGHMGVEMYFRDLKIDYSMGSIGKTAAVLYQGGRAVFENVSIAASDNLTAFRSLAKFNDYHKPSCLDLRNVRLNTGVAPVFSMSGDEFPNRVSVYDVSSEDKVRKPLFAFDREPTHDSIDRACGDAGRLMHEPPDQCLAIMIKNVDERCFDCTVPAELRQFVRQSVPDKWRRPFDRSSGSTFADDMPTGQVFSDGPIEHLLAKARAAGGGTVVLPPVWLKVTKTLDVPNNTRVTCVGRTALWMEDENAPIFRVKDGNNCVLENLLLIDGRHAVKVEGEHGRVRLLDCSLLGQKEASIFARSAKPAGVRIEMTGGQSFTPYLYRGNAAFTVDGFWYEESTERDKGENRPSYAAIVNETGGEMYFRDFLGVPCYFQNTPKNDAYVFGKNRERRGEFRWVDNYGVYVSINTRYGGEWGGLTPVFHFGNAVTWIEGGNIEIGNVYLKNERSVVVADSKRPDVTVVDAASGHHIEPFQVFYKNVRGEYEVAEAKLSGNYPFLPIVPVWPKGLAEDLDGEYEFKATFDWNGKDPVRFELEASCIATVWLNGEYIGNGPRHIAPAYSRQARFDLAPRLGRNEIVVKTKRGAPGFLLARVVEGVRIVARTAVEGGDFDCGLPLEERVKPPRWGKDVMAKVPRLETDIWQAEIDRVSSEGGGIVIVPKGVHPVGQLNLRSNVELRLEEGSVLEGVCGLEHYGQLVLPCSEGTWSAVVLAHMVTNVAITGKGTINGRGDRWSTSIACPEGVCKEGLRPRGVFFGDCRNVRLEDFELRDAACWGVVFKRCEDVVVRRVRIDSHANHNNDGLDVEARNVLIADCDIDSGDDAICIKSNDPDFVVENILVTNCTVRSHCNGLKLGTASHGTMRHIRFCDCRTANPRRNFKLRGGKDDGKMAYASRATDAFPLGIGTGAINIENVDGGVVEDIVFDGIEAMGFAVPIFVRGGRRMSRTCGIPRGRHSRLANLKIRNVRGESCRPHPCTITGVSSCLVKDIRMENVRIVCRGTNPAPVAEPGPEYDGVYPDAFMFFALRLPAYGLYANFVEGLQLDNVVFSLRVGDTDDRPPIYLHK